MKMFLGMAEFVKTVETGSFTDAAIQLGASKSFISKKITQLEERLSTQLLFRSTRNIRLTESGEQYYAYCSNLLSELIEVESGIFEAMDEPKGVLKISAPVTLGEFFITELLSNYIQNYPDIRIDLDLSTRNVDIIEESFDLAIRVGKLEDSNLYAKRLADFNFCVTASQGYLEKHGRPECIDDLARHNCLICSTNGPRQGSEWAFNTGNSNQDQTKRVYGNWSSNNCYTLIAAARKNLGLIYLPDFLVAAEVASGRLAPVLSNINLSSSIWAMYHAKKYVPAKVSKFIEYLYDEFSNNPPWYDEHVEKQDFLSNYSI